MKTRQKGTPMPKVINICNSYKDPTFNKLCKIVTIAAYNEPKFFVETNKKEAAVNFANEFYKECLKH
jgi:hypothetical protein